MTTDAAPPRAVAVLDRLRARLAALAGRRRMLAAAALGALAAAALPPVHALPLLFPAFVGLFWLIDDAPGPGPAFRDGFWFGAGFWAAGLYWIVLPFFVDAARYGWMAPLAFVGMAAGMGVFAAAVAGLSRMVFDRRALRPWGRVVVMGVLWAALEWVRGWLLTGFPWNLLATAWVVSDAALQVTAFIGAYGLGLLTVAIAAMPGVLADGDGKGGAWRPAAAAFLVLAVVWAGGAQRLAGAGAETVAGVRLRLVQPNIDQALKWRPDLRKGHVLSQIAMSTAPPATGAAPTPGPTHVIWAETAVPFVIDQTPGLINALAGAAPRGGALITGAPRGTPPGTEPARIWNSLHAVSADGRMLATYDKFHLVPFGEYVPLGGLLPVEKLTAGRRDFSPGPGPRTLGVSGLPPFSPLICYEAIFPGRVVAAGERPRWLLNITNDAWFGVSSGPYQHFAAARLRAVEEGLPLVRVANTGISGVIDAYGRVRRRLGLGRAGVIDSALPTPLAELTLFARFGGSVTAALLALTLAGALVLARTRGTGPARGRH